ncbi:hypothetical protein SUGI_0664970 [Cryptomeria japonica]|nr:hypothetical protein SUGI_0664970 [Cryptomeria japonica]
MRRVWYMWGLWRLPHRRKHSVMQLCPRLPPKKRYYMDFSGVVVKRLCSAYSIKLYHRWFPPRRGSNRVVALSVSISLGLALLSALFILAWFIQRRRRRLVEKFVKDDTSTSLRAFSYKELKVANKNFALKLGKGAFGSVFKGTLLDKSLVAVKKLEGFVQAKSS